jgi:3,4-dehydroadipyl-CoA semialdehyde dehydrogenase
VIRLESYVGGKWRSGTSDGRSMVNPTTGETIGHVDATGIDAPAALAYGRSIGGPALAGLSFAERGALLGKIADTLVANRSAYAEIARINSGNTERDAAIDIDGAIGTLKYYGRLGKTLGAGRALVEDGSDQLSRAETFRARHVWTTRPGVALHINAYNFPSWGLWEKVAASFLAGMPVVAKPASATAWLSERMVRDVVAAGLLPEGVLSLVCGAADGLVEALEPMDAVAFTGSHETGRILRGHARMREAAPRLTIEADSVNAAILSREVELGGPVFDLFLGEVVRALTVKAGQLCTNIRRAFVPQDKIDAVAEQLRSAMASLAVGDPGLKEVAVGPLVHDAQRRSALEGIGRLASAAEIVTGGGVPAEAAGADPARGAFLAPTLLKARSAEPEILHELEVFGPVVTLIPYRSQDELVALVRRGGGSLVASLYGEDPAATATLALRLAPHHGRVLVVDPEVGAGHTGHPIVMPQCVHGGPGRAGGGEELGGLRGLRFYMQRTALQGSPSMLDQVATVSAIAAL